MPLLRRALPGDGPDLWHELLALCLGWDNPDLVRLLEPCEDSVLCPQNKRIVVRRLQRDGVFAERMDVHEAVQSLFEQVAAMEAGLGVRLQGVAREESKPVADAKGGVGCKLTRTVTRTCISVQIGGAHLDSKTMAKAVCSLTAGHRQADKRRNAAGATGLPYRCATQ